MSPRAGKRTTPGADRERGLAMTTSTFASSSRPDSDSADGPTLLELLRSFPGQARLELGGRGVLLATLAGLVGLASCLVAFADIALSLHRFDVDPERQIGRAHV